QHRTLTLTGSGCGGYSRMPSRTSISTIFPIIMGAPFHVSLISGWGGTDRPRPGTPRAATSRVCPLVSHLVGAPHIGPLWPCGLESQRSRGGVVGELRRAGDVHWPWGIPRTCLSRSAAISRTRGDRRVAG